VNAPLEQFFDLGTLSAAEQDVRVAAKPDDLARIAQWADIPSVERFEAEIALRRLSQNRFSYEAKLNATAVQSCVVSLAPVPAQIERTFARELHLVSRLPRDVAAHGDHPVLNADEEEGPEDIESTRYDLVAPLLEEFALALDPYPRAPGVVFESPDAGEPPPESPFAVLKSLKAKD
jgi:uncharacterized metal-binding protein YceD (DUF177 family)